MLNYIKSEFYRNINTKGNYIFLFGFMAFACFLNIVLGIFANNDASFRYGSTNFSFSSFYTSMGAIMIICLPFVLLICGQEFKHSTLKNSISYGISRSQIYFSKFFVEIVIGTINLVLISASYIISAYIMLEDSGILHFNYLIRAIVACIPLFLVGVILAHCLYFILENEISVWTTWIILMIVVPKILSMLGRKIVAFDKIASCMPINIMSTYTYHKGSVSVFMSWNNQDVFIKCFIVGIIGTIIFYTLGLVLFKKRDIK
ncbi:ABC transporter permease subunit [Romboutsia lituseburensis]|nr:ABC transporter permease subunit [Romboutsia lituseburensis]